MEDKYLPSGEWEGFYAYDFNALGNHKMECVLQFNNCCITGTGTDDVGHYAWLGNYDRDMYIVNMSKDYNSHKVQYRGHADENGIWGKWSLGNMTGGFHLWPKKKEAVSSEASSVEKEIAALAASIF